MKQKKYKRGLVFGVWDLLHVAHFSLLRRAKEQCEELYVGVNTDDWVEKVKGHKPVFTLEERIKAIRMYASQFVDKVFIQDLGKNTKQSAVNKMHPTVIFVGDDHKNNGWDGEKLGVSVIYLPRTKGISSSILREKLQ